MTVLTIKRTPDGVSTFDINDKIVDMANGNFSDLIKFVDALKDEEAIKLKREETKQKSEETKQKIEETNQKKEETNQISFEKLTDIIVAGCNTFNNIMNMNRTKFDNSESTNYKSEDMNENEYTFGDEEISPSDIKTND